MTIADLKIVHGKVAFREIANVMDWARANQARVGFAGRSVDWIEDELVMLALRAANQWCLAPLIR